MYLCTRPMDFEFTDCGKEPSGWDWVAWKRQKKSKKKGGKGDVCIYSRLKLQVSLTERLLLSNWAHRRFFALPHAHSSLFSLLYSRTQKATLPFYIKSALYSAILPYSWASLFALSFLVHFVCGLWFCLQTELFPREKNFRTSVVFILFSKWQFF